MCYYGNVGNIIANTLMPHAVPVMFDVIVSSSTSTSAGSHTTRCVLRFQRTDRKTISYLRT